MSLLPVDFSLLDFRKYLNYTNCVWAFVIFFTEPHVYSISIVKWFHFVDIKRKDFKESEPPDKAKRWDWPN